jgi:glycosyltransferase involved in cell wall biosynthesis
MKKNKVLWFTWEYQRRSIELAKVFNAELILYDLDSMNRLLKYIYGGISTIYNLIDKRPKLVYGQNPSLILTLLLAVMKPLFGYKLVIDRHTNFKLTSNKGLVDYVYHRISDFTLRKSDLTIVTNDYLAKLVQKKRGHSIVLEDKLPDMRNNGTKQLDGSYNIAFVTSFSKDEPIIEVIEALKDINDDVNLYVTGNNKKYDSKVIDDAKKISNIHFTGYLSENDFMTLLHSVDAIIVLTKFDYTMTCGAYEGVSIGKPMILSNTSVIKDYFTKGVIYCEPEKQSILNSVRELIQNHDKMQKEILELNAEITEKWNKRILSVKNVINNLSGMPDGRV